MKKKNIFYVLSIASLSTAVFGTVAAVSQFNGGEATAATPDVIISNDTEMAAFISKVNEGVSSSTSTEEQTFDGKLIHLTNDVSITLSVQPKNDKTTPLYSFFKGTFDGNGHKINVTYNSSDNACALFRNNNGIFKNVEINGTFTCGDYLSAVCVYNNKTIENVTVNATFNGTNDTAPFCFSNSSLIKDCVSSSTVNSSAKRTAGICCKNTGTIQGCTNNGAVTSADTIASGIVNENNGGKIISCTNNGDVSALKYACGIAYYNQQSSEITDCLNTGDLNAQSFIGGISYKNNASSITNTINTGAINANGTSASDDGRIGGIASYNEAAGVLTNCVNKGNIQVNTGIYMGGIAGFTSDKSKTGATITNCRNLGNLNCDNASSSAIYAGGIVGFSYGNTIITDSTNYGNVTIDRSTASGIVGCPAYGATTITRCANVGTIETSYADGNAYIGGAVGYHYTTSKKEGTSVVNYFLSAGDLKTARTTESYYIGPVAGHSIASVSGKESLISICNMYGKKDCDLGTVVATSCSDDVKNLIKYVREFNCEADYKYLDELETLLGTLSDGDTTLMSGITYFDKSESADHDYVSAASFIVAYNPTTNTLPLNNIFADSNNLVAIIAISSFVLIGTALVVILRKKNHIN